MNNNNHNIDRLFAEHFSEKAVHLTNREVVWDDIQARRSTKSRGWLFGFSLLALIGLIGMSLNFYLSQEDQSKTTAMEELIPSATANSSESNAPNNLTSSLWTETDNLEQESELTQAQQLTTISKETLDSDEVNNSSEPFSKESGHETYGLTDEEKPTDKSTVFSKADSDYSATSKTSINSTRQNVVKAINHVGILDLKLDVIDQSELNLLSASSHDLADVELEENRGPEWSKCSVKPRGSWYIDAYGQGVKVLSSYKSKILDDTYRNAYEDKFTPALGYMVGVMAGYKFPIGITLAGGIEYQEYQSKYENTQQIIEQIRIYDPMAYFIIDSNGNRVYVGDTVNVTRITDRKETKASTSTLINIPIHLGYERDINGWIIGADIQALLNIDHKFEGLHMIADRSIAQLEKDNFDTVYETSTGLQADLGIHFGRMINDNLEVYASPRFRIMNKNLFNENQDLELRHSFAGVRLGARWHFN